MEAIAQELYYILHHDRYRTDNVFKLLPPIWKKQANLTLKPKITAEIFTNSSQSCGGIRKSPERLLWSTNPHVEKGMMRG